VHTKCVAVHCSALQCGAVRGSRKSYLLNVAHTISRAYWKSYDVLEKRSEDLWILLALKDPISEVQFFHVAFFKKSGGTNYCSFYSSLSGHKSTWDS